MKKYPFLLSVTVILLGWLFDFLFWEHPLGINFAIYLTLCLLAGLGLLLAITVSGCSPGRQPAAGGAGAAIKLYGLPQPQIPDGGPDLGL